MTSYTELLKLEAKNDTFKFNDFINQLSNGNLFSFIEDILTENDENIRPAFPPFKGVYTDDLAFQAIREMPYATYQKIQTYLEDIFSFAIKNKYPNSDKVISNIIALTARRRQGLSVLYIKDLIANKDINDNLKTNLGILLSKIENTVPLSFWDTDIDYTKQPYLIPAFISAYKNAYPVKALEILINIRKKPSGYQYYRKSITTSLENILIRERDFRSYIALYEKMPDWVKSEFDLILNTTNFLKHRISEEIIALKANKTEIRIGISLFPDLLLLQYAYELGYFSGDKKHSYNIKIVDWNNNFDLLMDEELDFIIANRDVYTIKNGTRPLFKLIYPLIEYKGFSIVFQKDYQINTFNTVKAALGNENEAIKQTLLQLKKKNDKIKIFASKNTDHYNTLVDMLDLVGLKPTDVSIISDKEPYDGYALFANKEVDAIVGGLPQRLAALKSGGKELISQSDSDLPFTQVNALICRDFREEELKKPADIIIYEWGKIVSEIKKHPELLTELVKLYNSTSKEVEQFYNPIDEEMFRVYWEKTFFIPSNQTEIKNLSTDTAMKENQEKLKKIISEL